jgi:V/A-type H+-transporting ATPase subunit K
MVLLEQNAALGLAAAVAIAGGAIGTGMAQASIGAATMGVLAERPEETFKLIVYMALPELIVLLGFVVGFLLIGKFEGAVAPA